MKLFNTVMLLLMVVIIAGCVGVAEKKKAAPQEVPAQEVQTPEAGDNTTVSDSDIAVTGTEATESDVLSEEDIVPAE